MEATVGGEKDRGAAKGEKDHRDMMGDEAVDLPRLVAVASRVSGGRVRGAEAFEQLKGGFVGEVVRLKGVRWDSEATSVVLKLPPTLDVFVEQRFHAREVALYALAEAAAGAGGVLPVPRCHGGDAEGLLLDDLAPRVTRPFAEGLARPALVAAAAAAGRLHRELAAAPAAVPRPEAPLPLGAFPLAFVDVAALEAATGGAVAEAARSLVRRRDHWLRRWADPADCGPHGVMHGDLWSNNVMFADGDDSAPVLVDFQLAREGPLLFDLATLLFSSAREHGQLAAPGSPLERAVLDAYLGALGGANEAALRAAWARGGAQAYALALLAASVDIFQEHPSAAPRLVTLAARVRLPRGGGEEK